MAYEQDYFGNRKYQEKAELVKRHVLSVLRWASKATGTDLLNGQGKTALDVGCAYGYTTEVLNSLCYKTVGVDISGWGIHQAKALSGKQFLICDAQVSLPFVEGRFDLVTCFDVLEHLPHPEAALLGMFEASRGILVCTTPNRKVEKPIRKLMRDYDETHISTKTPIQWQQLAACTLGGGSLKVEAFYDLAARLGGKLFFKSFSIPKYGLTVRIVVRR